MSGLSLVSAVASAIILWWLIAFGLQDYLLDRFRQKLFAIRDQLFDDAVRLDMLRTEAYQQTRITINGMIRFAHEITIADFISHLLFVRASEPRISKQVAAVYLKDFTSALNELSKEQQEYVMKAQLDMHVEVLKELVRGSIVLIPIYWAVLAISTMLSMADEIRHVIFQTEKSKRRWAELDATAYEIGNPSNTVAA